MARPESQALLPQLQNFRKGHRFHKFHTTNPEFPPVKPYLQTVNLPELVAFRGPRGGKFAGVRFGPECYQD